MSLVALAFTYNRLVAFLCAAILAVGVWSFLSYPSQEEPTIPVKEALVIAEVPGVAAAQAEALVAIPLEQALRRLEGVKHLSTTIRGGVVQVRVQAQDSVVETRPFFERLRAYVQDARSVLPQEVISPHVFDDYGEVAVATLALTAPGFEWSEIHLAVSKLRDGIYAMPGVSRVSLHGLPGERVYVRMDSRRLSTAGLTPEAVSAQLAAVNILEAAGGLDAGSQRIFVAAKDAFSDLEALRDTPLRLTDGRTLALRHVAEVERGTELPLRTATISNGQRAVVLAVAMSRGQDVQAFGASLKAEVARLEPYLPAGMRLEWVTFQADVVEKSIGDVATTLYQTMAVVVVATMLVLGWRTGLLVGALVPLTILGALLMMKPLGLELHNVSIAAFIIALGILVDNGTVVAEDVLRRMSEGESSRSASIEAGKTLSFPLFVATGTAILAFSPPFFSQSYAAQFLKGLSLVIAITLALSWLLAVTAIPLGLHALNSRKKAVQAPVDAKREEKRYDRGFYARYRSILNTLLRVRWVFLGAMVAALVGALALFSTLPQGFLGASARSQLQVPIELPPGTGSARTLETLTQLSKDFSDPKLFPQLKGHVAYAGEGGPRFILGLNPPDAAASTGYVVLNVREDTSNEEVLEAIRKHLRERYPDVRARPGEFSLGQGDPGTLLLRLSGPDAQVLRSLSEQVQTAMWSIEGAVDVRSDWEALVPRLEVQVDAAKANAAGVAPGDVLRALQFGGDGRLATVYREGDRLIPIVLRSQDSDELAHLWSAVVPTSNGGAVPLTQVATLRVVGEQSVLARRDLVPTVTLLGRRPGMAASEYLEVLQPALKEIPLPAGYAFEIGGEIQDAEDANAAIAENLPLAILLIVCIFLVQFNSARKVVIVLACFPFCLIGAVAALAIGRVGFDFVGFLGVLALAGTIVSNAILVLERNEVELAAGKKPYDALVDAAVARLRPIFITQLTTILGLVPFMLSDQKLWTAFNLVVAGGLTGGTLISLGMVPVLYSLLFKVTPDTPAAARSHA